MAVADAAALAKAAAERMLARIAANSGRVAICLTGGSSPKQLYRLLATTPYRSRIPWERVHWFIGDERFVPAGDPLNNMGMARTIFLDQCAPASNVHPIPTATADPADPDRSAALYEHELKSFYGADVLDPARPGDPDQADRLRFAQIAPTAPCGACRKGGPVVVSRSKGRSPRGSTGGDVLF